MTYAITLIKGETGKREQTLKYLTDLKDDLERQKTLLGEGVCIKECYISFGWPDFVLLVNGNNVELLKSTIVKLRDLASNDPLRDNLETSTIICMTKDEIDAATGITRDLIEK